MGATRHWRMRENRIKEVWREHNADRLDVLRAAVGPIADRVDGAEVPAGSVMATYTRSLRPRTATPSPHRWVGRCSWCPHPSSANMECSPHPNNKSMSARRTSTACQASYPVGTPERARLPDKTIGCRSWCRCSCSPHHQMNRRCYRMTTRTRRWRTRSDERRARAHSSHGPCQLHL
jgi:hypothetical protein